MTDDRRRAALESIGAEVAVCTRCRLHETRTRAVPGEGNPDTEVMFVGEGPGFNEDRQGRPFVGQAGALLTDLLASVGWQRDEVFITNVVKCRPPNNRDPEPDEIAACSGFLARQLEVLDPALVVTLGRFSMARFNPGARIGQVHGTFRQADASSGAPEAFTFAMYHPAAALHQGSLKQTLFDDMTAVPAALVAAREARAGKAEALEAQAAAKALAEAEAGAIEPALERPEPASEPVDAVEPVAQPGESSAQPVEHVAKPVESLAQPTEHVDEPVESVAEPQGPVAGAAGPPAEPVEPLAQPAEPVEPPTEPIEPVARPVESVAEPVEPPTEPIDSVAARAEPVAEAEPDSNPFEPPASGLGSNPEEVRDPRAQLTLF